MTQMNHDPMHGTGKEFSRRNMIKGSVAAGALAWSAPMILSRSAAQAQVVGGSPVCPAPTVSVECGVILNLGLLGAIAVEGLQIDVGDCLCTPGVDPTVCVTIVAEAGSDPFTPLVVVGGAVVGVLPLGVATCLAADASLVFAPAVDLPDDPDDILDFLLELLGGLLGGDDLTFSFRIGVSASCPDGDEFVTTCVTFGATITIGFGFLGSVDIECGGVVEVPGTDPDSLCTGDATPPCACP
jgi:hypothetical protein